MNLYIYTGRLDVAAATLADLAAAITALGSGTTAPNATTLARVKSRLPEIVQSDSGEPLNLNFYDDATTPASWVTDATVTLAAGLGNQDPRSAYTYASTTSFTISGNTRLGTLSLNTTNLRDALEAARACLPIGAPVSVTLYLHLRKTTAAGATETVGLIPITVHAGVLTATPEDMDEQDYPTLETFRAAAVLHLGAVTSLTGGGESALDGIDAGSDEHPVGCIRLTSSDDAPRHWKLKGTYIAASDVDAGLIKPTNSDATLNPCHWALLQ